jgi:hypothetical protein
MFKYSVALFFIYTVIGSISAQTFIGKINPIPVYTSVESQENDTIRILGIMVNFQEDRDGATFGNGKFGSIYSRSYGTDILDPLPHDKVYFEAHLEFVKNYFNKVSNGIVQIEYFVLPDTISVSQTMRNYAPEPNSDDFIRTANFAREVWDIADEAFPGFDFNRYDVFTIFHAGVGRDVSLPGSIGNERDLPSLYLGLNALKQLFGESFEGFPVSGGNFRITNSMIIPETESREVESIGGTVLFELSINGLLTASVASYLGLPDLFNTETGFSAIGRFGLMDGQAIFAYSGTFPPEPSAWEKIYLGWEEPVTVEPGDFNINLITKPAAEAGDTVILKVPINSSEYYLVENRIRDANSDGAIITYVVNGQVSTRTFTKDTTGFESFDVDSISGVVTNVDEFDWAIPNSISVENTPYDPKPGGGIVIWHIDEKIINEKIAENKINVDKENRGVDIEEADGIQDIGERFFTIFGDEIVGEGFTEDFWFAGNRGEFFENKFSRDTRPNTNTNSGANSLITFSNFSSKSNRMSFRLSYGDSLVKPVFSKDLNIPQNENNFLNVSQTTSSHSFNLISGSNLYIIDSQGDLINTVNNFSDLKTASLFLNNSNYVYGAKNSFLNLLKDDSLLTIDIGENITTAPVIVQLPSGQYQVLVGTENRNIRQFHVNLDPLFPPTPVGGGAIIKIAANDSYYSFVTAEALFDSDGNVFNFNSVSQNLNKSLNINHDEANNLILTKDRNGNYVSIVLYAHQNIFVISEGQLINSFSFNADELTNLSLVDLKKDGENYLLIPNSSLEVKNLLGASSDYFPFSKPDNIFFNITPLSADFYGDNKPEIISFSSNGNIFAIDEAGKAIDNFPISAGEELACTPVLFNSNGKISLAVFDKAGNFSAWNIGPTQGAYHWSEQNGNNQNTSFVDAASAENFVNDFFPENRVYNYPNPVYENTTFIRYYVSEDAKVNIKIFDLAGGLVDELNDNAQGGFDNETGWDVGDIQSGVYLARVEATGSNGKSENKIIKIAVIK